MKKKKPKKLSPIARKKEATGININALKKRVKALEDKVTSLEALVKGVLNHHKMNWRQAFI